MASSSSSIATSSWTYDVFLNFRGEDTRNNFTSHLHHVLRNKGINTFIDDKKLERGKAISTSLLQAIEKSRISIVILSSSYTFSFYCLDELLKIVECKKSKGQVVLPVFYKVDPSHVEEQTGSFGLGLRLHQHSSKANEEKLQQWRQALTEVAGLSGWHLDSGNENEFILKIAETVSMILNRTFLRVADCPVGLDSHVSDVKSKLNIGSNDVRMVGIWGIGGIGKTTAAKALYNSIVDQFEGSCFLENVGEMSKQNRVVELQETLLSQILRGEKIFIGNSDLGVNLIRESLCSKKVLVIVDDVNDMEQVRKLAGEPNWFGVGSRIIITSRDEHLLVSHGVESVHKVEELCPSDALQLFSWNAFRKRQPPENFMEISHEVIKYSQGLPLALVVLGSLLYGRSVQEWESEIDKLKRVPNKEICEILKRSYECLEDNEKDIFLDIACFFRGSDSDYVMKILHAFDFNPVIGVKVLMEKSLICIENNKIEMHDLIQAMGREVVKHQSPNIPGRRSRLWFHEDVIHVLTEDTGTEEIEGIMLDSHEPEEIHMMAEAFEKMKRLRVLIIRNARLNVAPACLPNKLRWLEWPGCPLLSMPPKFHARKLVLLNMQSSCINQLKEFKNYKCLKSMDFRDCVFLKETPDFSSIPNLERLNLGGCTNLMEVHQSVGFLDKLEFLSVEFCSNLRTLPGRFKLKSVDTLLIAGCEKLEVFPDIVGKMPCLEKLCLTGTALKVLPPSIKNITHLKVLNVTFCKSLANLPCSIYMLAHLERLLLEGCSKLGEFPVNKQNEKQPNYLVPPSGFPMLRWLDLKNCNLKDVNFLSMPECFVVLKELDLSGNDFIILPALFSKFPKLKCLKLSECKNLRKIPDLPRNIKRLEARDCELLEKYSQLATAENRSTRCSVFDFSNCNKLAENQGKNILDALLVKGFYSDCVLDMFLPGSEIPNYVSYTSAKNSLTFLLLPHMCEKIKALVFYAILCTEDASTANISCKMSVYGRSKFWCSRQLLPFKSEHIWFYSYPYRHESALQIGSGALLNHLVLFEISFEVLGGPKQSALKRCGVHIVYKQNERVNDSSSNHSKSHHTESVSFDLMRTMYHNDLELNLNVGKNRSALRIPEALDITELQLQQGLFSGASATTDLEMNLIEEMNGSALQISRTSVKTELQLQQWLSLSLQPMDLSNWDPMCIKKLEEKVQLRPNREQKFISSNFFDILGSDPIAEDAAIRVVEATDQPIFDADTNRTEDEESPLVEATAQPILYSLFI